MNKITIKARLIFVIALLSVMLIGIGVLGVRGMAISNQDMDNIYQDRLIPTGQIAEIEGLMRGSIIELQLASMHDPRMEESRLHDHPITLHTDRVGDNINRIGDIWAEYIKTTLTPEEARLAQTFTEQRDQFIREGLRPAVTMYNRGDYGEANTHMVLVTNPAFGRANLTARELLQLQLDVAAAEYQHAEEVYANTRNITVIAIVIGILLASVIGFLLIRAIVGPLNRTIGYFGEIANGNLDNDIEVKTQDETGRVLEGLKQMQAKLKADITEATRAANENLRIKSALDSVTANVMVADPDHNVIYINNAVQQMFRRGAADIRKDLPNFDADRLVGANIDIFHKNPSHQRQMLDALRTAFSTEIVVGGRTFALVASPISNTDGERIGTAVQWTDRTDEVAVEKEISHLVEAAVRGDFTTRIDMAGKEDFFERLSTGVNELMRITDSSLNEVVRVLGELAQGNLTEQVVGDFQGTFGRLKDDTNHSVSKLNELIGLVTESVDAINTGAKEIAAGNSDLSQRTEEQASSLEETASSMEQLTSTVKQNADNARQANQLSNQAQEVAVHGGEKTRQAMDSMKAITDSADKIADIITVIDGIAFQTNILALNAAVEAARAGEQGRGFAVVAGEVRNLAQRSASAAKEIKALISEDSQTIAAGSKLVMEAGGTMEEIVNQVKRVSDLIAEISAASDEQSAGIEQVNTAITQMDEVTQQNA